MMDCASSSCALQAIHFTTDGSGSHGLIASNYSKSVRLELSVYRDTTGKFTTSIRLRKLLRSNISATTAGSETSNFESTCFLKL